MYRYHKNYSRNSVYEQANAQTFEKFPKHEKLTQTKFKWFHDIKTFSCIFGILTTNLELTFCRICFSFRAILSPLRFLIRFFSSFLHAYIFPVARTWHAQTSPNPPFPSTLYIRNVFFVTGWLKKKNWFFKFKIHANKKTCIIFRISHICNFYPSCVFSMPISLDKLWGRKHTLSLKVYFPYLIIKL